MGPIEWTPGGEIDPDPDAPESVCLPFWLVDSDGPDAHRIVTVPVCLPPDWLAAILVLAERYLSEREATPLTDPTITLPPTESDPTVWATSGGRAETWRVCAEFLLLAGTEQLAGVLPAFQQAANTDPDVFLRYEHARARVRDLFGRTG